jgi:hypothetical protein
MLYLFVKLLHDRVYICGGFDFDVVQVDINMMCLYSTGYTDWIS